MSKKKLVIVSGANGSLGREYLKYFSKKIQYQCIGLSRSKTHDKIKNVDYAYLDLLDSKKVDDIFKKIDLTLYEQVILIHPVGKFIFEEREISEDKYKEIYNSNIKTFLNLNNFLLPFAKKKKLVLCAFGSVSDKFGIPFWKSYSVTKRELKRVIKDLSKLNNIRGIFINISTVFTKNEDELRPKADKTYWLTPKKIVLGSIREIISGKSPFIELNIFEPNPSFEKSYYTDHNKIYKKWKKEMGK